MNCPRCLKNGEIAPLIRKKHDKITPKMLKKAYIFSKWDFCPKCKYVQHYNEFKTTCVELEKELNLKQGALIKV